MKILHLDILKDIREVSIYDQYMRNISKILMYELLIVLWAAVAFGFAQRKWIWSSKFLCMDDYYARMVLINEFLIFVV